MAQTIIRAATLQDNIGIAKVHIQAWRESYQGLVPPKYLDELPSKLESKVAIWINILSNSQQWVWVAERRHNIVGFISLGSPRDNDREEFVELRALYLQESEQGKKIGFSLLSTGFNKMRELGYEKVYCWILENNPTGKFYEKTGARLSNQTKQIEISGKLFNEFEYEWSL